MTFLSCCKKLNKINFYEIQKEKVKWGEKCESNKCLK